MKTANLGGGLQHSSNRCGLVKENKGDNARNCDRYGHLNGRQMVSRPKEDRGLSGQKGKEVLPAPHSTPQGEGISEILLPTDLSAESRKAIAYAVPLAKTWNAHLTLLHIYKTPYNLNYMRGPHLCSALKQQRQHSENALQLLGQRVKEQYCNCSTDFREGTVDEEVAKAAKDLQADLIVIGTHRNGWFERITYGSDAESIVRLSSCPVFVVPGEERDCVRSRGPGLSTRSVKAHQDELVRGA